MSKQIALSDIAHGRSGDKGNHANVAIIAYTQAGYDWLRATFDGRAGGGILRADAAIARRCATKRPMSGA